MSRFIALMVAVAHLGVATIPCRQGELATLQPAAPVAVTATHANHGSGHEPPTNAHHGDQPRQTATIHRDAAHAHHASPPAQDTHHRHASAHSPEARAIEASPYELRAPCLCGCTKAGTTTATPSSPRVGFALFPPKSPELPEIAPRLSEVAGDLMPGPRPDSLDHVPIPS